MDNDSYFVKFSIIFILLGILVAANAFFVAAEMALARVRRTRIDQLAEQGSTTAKTVQSYLDDPDTFISGTQLGITFAMLIIGAVGETTFAEDLSEWATSMGVASGWKHNMVIFAQVFSYGLVFTITAFIQTVFGELLPKTLTFNRAETVVMYTIYPMHFWCIITRPILVVMNAFMYFILKVLKVPEPSHHHMVHSEAELKMLVSASLEEGVIEEGEEEMLHSVFELSDTVATEIMTPRRDMKMLSADKPVKDLIELALKHGHSRIPLYDDNVDNIFGMVHIRDGIRAFADGKQSSPIRELARKVLIVPENKGLADLLAEFKKTKTHMAIVVDEHGGTQGMVTLEDLLEELVGEIADEHDIEQEFIKPQEDGTILIDARIALEDLNDRLDMNIQDEEFNTLGGYVFGYLGHEPVVGHEVKTDEYTFRIEEADRHRIISIRLTKHPKPEPVEEVKENNGRGHKRTTEVEVSNPKNLENAGS